jgi:hypothetical protein
MLRTTLCAVAALFLAANILMAAEPQKVKADKPCPVTIVKMDVGKHLLVFKKTDPAGKEVEVSLPIKEGVQLPKFQPGNKFLMVAKEGKVIALQPMPVEKPIANVPAPAPVAKGPATKEPPVKVPPAKVTLDKTAQAFKAIQARLVQAKDFLAHVNHDRVIAKEVEKDSTATFQTALANLDRAKAAVAQAVKERDEAIKVAMAKAEAARVAQIKAAEAKQVTAQAYEAKVLAAKLAKIEEHLAKVATKDVNQAQAAFDQAGKPKIAAEKKVNKEVKH